MKSQPLFICLSLGFASVATTAPAGPGPTTTQVSTPSGLWLTVRFDSQIPFSVPYGMKPPPNSGPDAALNTAVVPDAEISTLVTANTRFQQQFTCPKGRYGIAGVLGAATGGQYPLSIRLTGGPSEWCETQVKLSLNKPYTWGVSVSHDRGAYTLILSRAPEWQPPNKPLDLTPH